MLMHHVELKRFYLPGAIYFITSVTEGRIPLFVNEKNLIILANIIVTEKERLGFLVSGYALLPDHIHLIIKPGESANISRIMATIKALCAKAINARLNTTGKVWQHQFMDHIIRTSKDYQRHIEYIHRNPLKHGLVNDIKEYRWSSWHQYQGTPPEDIKVDVLDIKPGRMF